MNSNYLKIFLSGNLHRNLITYKKVAAVVVKEESLLAAGKTTCSVTIQVHEVTIPLSLVPSSGSKGGRNAENVHVSSASGINTSGQVNIDVNVPE